MPVFNAYRYEPLHSQDEIRLLVLNPAKNKTTPLSCSIVRHRRVSETRKYSAVSYAWGEATRTHSLEITYSHDTSYLKITPNVDILLRHLRAPREVRHLWIDAICLNQDDETEKAHQIPVMGRIYKEATNVQIWLGVGNDMTSTLCEFFREVSRGPDLKQIMMADHIVALMKRFFDNDAQPTLDEDWFEPGCRVGFNCWAEFFNNPWFSRRWIIQEAVLARKAIVRIGNYDMPLGTVTLASKRLQNFDMSDYPMKMAATMGDLTKNSSLLENLWNFHEACCSEKKDRVASLIGLSPGDGLDLHYNMPWEHIFKQAASSALCSQSNDTRIQVLLHLFEFGAVMNTETIDYPSWVPDWSKTRRRELPYHSNIKNVDTHEKYPAVLTVSDKATLTLKDNILHINPRISDNRTRLWQVVRTMYSGKSHFESGQVTDLLDRFFPLSSAESPEMILEFCSFIQYIGDFRHLRDADKPAAFEIYTGQLLRKLSGPVTSKHFEALGWLRTLLQDLYFCDLRPYGRGTGSSRGFAISPGRLLPDDIVIPLWRRIVDGAKYRYRDSRPRTTIEITTMLVVRYDGGSHRLPECRTLEDDVEIREGRIIGAALGIEFGRTVVLEETPISKSELSIVEGGILCIVLIMFFLTFAI